MEVSISRQNHRLSFLPTSSSTSHCLELLRRVRHGETSGSKSGNRILYRAGTISHQAAVYPKYTLGALNMKEEPCQCSVVHGFSWWMGLWGGVKCQGVCVYLLELKRDEVICAYEGSKKAETKHDVVTALVFHSQATVWISHQPETMHCTILIYSFIYMPCHFIRNVVSLKQFVCLRNSVMMFLSHLDPQLQPPDAHTIYSWPDSREDNS
jgi:hypothetical protein